VLKNRSDLSPDDLRRTRDLMDMHVRDCLVENFEDLIPVLELPDPKDRHVLAAAIRGRADVIVTYGQVDFPMRYPQGWRRYSTSFKYKAGLSSASLVPLT